MVDYINRIKAYVELERKVLNSLDLSEINTVINVLEKSRLNGNRVFTCGNGGSAATASHFCCDFNKGVSCKQDKKYDFECLNDNTPTMMAIANDISYDEVFVMPLRNKLSKGDVLIGISGSGNSTNVVKAIEYANEVGAVSVGIVGYDGGKIKSLAKYSIHVKIDNMQIVEDVHMMMDHVIMYVLSENNN